MYQPLTREEVISVIEGKGAASRVPVILQMWTHPWGYPPEERRQIEELMETYPCDVQTVYFNWPGKFEAPADDPDYRWANKDDPQKGDNKALDEHAAIEDYDTELDGVLEHFPNPNYPNMWPEFDRNDKRYRLGHFWYFFYEFHWNLRGMQNALTDYYLYPDEVHRLFSKAADFYCAVLERGKRELNLDGLLVSDDLGTQKGPFFSPEIFREFFFPYYKRVCDKAHELGMHLWLHSCGDNEALLPQLIEAGVDVFHPVQKYTMDEVQIAKKFGDQICFWAGFDVQQTIPWGTTEDVKNEIHHLFDTYYRKDGRFMFTAGNGINEDCPVDSLKMLYSESYRYGEEIARKNGIVK